MAAALHLPNGTVLHHDAASGVTDETYPDGVTILHGPEGTAIYDKDARLQAGFDRLGRVLVAPEPEGALTPALFSALENLYPDAVIAREGKAVVIGHPEGRQSFLLRAEEDGLPRFALMRCNGVICTHILPPFGQRHLVISNDCGGMYVKRDWHKEVDPLYGIAGPAALIEAHRGASRYDPLTHAVTITDPWGETISAIARVEAESETLIIADPARGRAIAVYASANTAYSRIGPLAGEPGSVDWHAEEKLRLPPSRAAAR